MAPDTEDRLNDRRTNYDRFIANLDAEFGKLMDALEASGALEQTYVLLTSDHGEMFERGQRGHSTPLLFDPVIRIPLLIAGPGIDRRTDVHSPTNSVDVLPTILHLAGVPVPNWCEGRVLPALGGVEDPQRATFSVEAKSNPAFLPLTKATVAMRKGRHKLIYYVGYEAHARCELYDMEADPEELQDLYDMNSELSVSLLEELTSSLQAADREYS
jgi:arylsulfatase A-like enzyme